MYYNYADLNYMNQELAGVWPGWTAVKLLGRGSYGAVYEIHRKIRTKAPSIGKISLETIARSCINASITKSPVSYTHYIIRESIFNEKAIRSFQTPWN